MQKNTKWSKLRPCVCLFPKARSLHIKTLYLVDHIAGLPDVEVGTEIHIAGLNEAAACRVQSVGRASRAKKMRHLFLFIGADPNTAWVSGAGAAFDTRGFVLTGEEPKGPSGRWKGACLECSSIGDIRSVSVKRVAAAAGEGLRLSSRSCLPGHAGRLPSPESLR
jgi:thioredoxin reductase (NADPH)